MKRHGECKTPGGKLAAVDLVVDDRRIAAATVHGDFFIHPEPDAHRVLSGLAAALIGPADRDAPALAAALRAAIPFGVELLGTSPEAIALAVRRAVEGEDSVSDALPVERIGTFTPAEAEAYLERWSRLSWRLLPERPLPPALNVALDEALFRDGTPTLRFWRWDAPAVIVGRCQAVSNEVEAAVAQRMNVQVVRRMTGGGAMFLQPHGAITYSIHVPEAALAGLTLRQSYEVCDAWAIRALRELGVDAHHVPINDIACGEGKIGGAAQARRGGAVLHHTTLAYDMDPGEMVKILRIGREKLKDKGVASAAKRVSPLVRQTGLSRKAIVAALFAAFQTRFGGTLDELTADEIKVAEQLVGEKYAHPEWTTQFD